MTQHKREVVVRDPIGLHARPVGEIIKLVKSSGIRISVARPGSDPLAIESPLRLLALKVKSGESLEFWFYDAESSQVDQLTLEIEQLLSGS